MEVDRLGVLSSLHVGLKGVAAGAGDGAQLAGEALASRGGAGRGGRLVLLDLLLVQFALEVGLVRLGEESRRGQRSAQGRAETSVHSGTHE